MKKTQRTSKADIDLATARLAAIPAMTNATRVRDDGKVIAGDNTYDDVWDAIEPTPEAAAVARACSHLMDATVARVQSWNLTQREAVERLGIKQPRLNQLLKGRIGMFSLDALMELAVRAGLKVDVVVRDDSRHAA